MAFWINIYGCQPYPRHGSLKVNQLKNHSFRQALYQPGFMSENVRALQGQVPELILHTDRVDCQAYSKSQNEPKEHSLFCSFVFFTDI